MRRILRRADPAATFPVTLTSTRRVEPWRAPTVTLLGDALYEPEMLDYAFAAVEASRRHPFAPTSAVR